MCYMPRAEYGTSVKNEKVVIHEFRLQVTVKYLWNLAIENFNRYLTQAFNVPNVLRVRTLNDVIEKLGGFHFISN